MHTTNRFLASLLAASVLVVPAAASHAAREQKPLPDLTVFIDPPTGFVFVKLPQGWKYVDDTEVARTAAAPEAR